MKHVDLSQLPSYLQERRWFSGKPWPIKSISVVDQLTLPVEGAHIHGPAEFVVAVLEVHYTQGGCERYVLPVISTGEGFRDALDEPGCARALLALVRDGRQVASGSGRARGEQTAHAAATFAALSPSPQVRKITSEQSNTSLVFDDQVILKVIRKLESGLNPELELGAFLASANFQHAPPLLGAIQLEGSVLTGTLAVAHRFVPNQADGWTFLVGALRGGDDAQVLSGLAGLGRRVAELHLTCADGTGAAFLPEPIKEEDLQRWSASIIGEIGVTLAAAGHLVPGLAERRPFLVAQAQRLAHATPSGLKIRIHGDLHLGQTLRTADDWLIFDFEGEPARSFTQRRELHSPLRDVAGMLRSFDYAVATLERGGHPARPPTQALRQAFLTSYRQTVGSHPLLPDTAESFQALLETLELEKLLYELRYEVQNRPDWVDIPARGIAQLEA